MGASTYTQTNVLNALLRGEAMPLPTGTFVSLHTGDPGATGANEVATTDWPAYVRRQAEGSGAIGTGWTTPTGGLSLNLNQLIYPAKDGASPITISHFAVWDALTAGNCLDAGTLATPRILNASDIVVFDVGSLSVTVS